MTEKRFKIIIGEFEEENIMDAVKKIEITEISDMCTQMNALHEENQSLKFQLDECRNNKLFSRRQLEKENEQLKKEKEYFLKVIFAMGDYAEMVDYEKIIDASDAVKRRFLND